MVMIDELSEIATMPHGEFYKQFMPIMRGKAFVHVSACDCDASEIQEVGEQLYGAGMRCVDPSNVCSILTAVDAVAQRASDDAMKRT